MGKGKYGKKLKIPEVLECRETRNYVIKLNSKSIIGRPPIVLLKLIELGMNKGLWDKSIIERIIHHGFDRNYFSDADITVAIGKYFFKDMNHTKAERLKEIESEK